MIDIIVNGKREQVPSGMNVRKLRDWVKPDANIMLINGYPCSLDEILKQGDQILFIRKGEVPDPHEFDLLFASRHSRKVQEQMKKATIGIAGLGGLGSAVCIALARMGIGHLIVADYDFVEPSNLHRQQYSINHIGMAKVDAVVEIISGINPYMKISAHRVRLTVNNISDIFGDADIVIECLDQPEEKAMLIETVIEYLPDVTVIGASGIAGYGRSNHIVTRRLTNRLFVIGDLASEVKVGQPLMAGRVGIAAHHQANLVVCLLMKDPNDVVADVD